MTTNTTSTTNTTNTTNTTTEIADGTIVFGAGYPDLSYPQGWLIRGEFPDNAHNWAEWFGTEGAAVERLRELAQQERVDVINGFSIDVTPIVDSPNRSAIYIAFTNGYVAPDAADAE